MSQITELDAQVVAIAKRVHLLGALSWPGRAADDFLSAHRRGATELPTRPAPPPHEPDEYRALREIAKKCDRGDPRGAFVAATAEAYAVARDMLHNVGTPAFYRCSRDLFGGADGRLPNSDMTHLEAADQLLASTAALSEATREHEADFCLTAEAVAAELREGLAEIFTAGEIEVVIDPDLSAKAAASARRIRVRGAACFSDMDAPQLLQHEAFVHAATALNGRAQPQLSCLSLSAPRTTETQEGLATFAELVTGAMDLARLRRLALRIRAVHLAESGADFIETFRALLDLGEPESEAVRTTMRIFRGGDLKGRHVFTKDVVYLRGLLHVHTFLRTAIANNEPQLIERLFVGRLSTDDVGALAPCFEDGTLERPRYVPRWARQVRALAAYLAVSVVVANIDVGSLTAQPSHAPS